MSVARRGSSLHSEPVKMCQSPHADWRCHAEEVVGPTGLYWRSADEASGVGLLMLYGADASLACQERFFAGLPITKAKHI